MPAGSGLVSSYASIAVSKRTGAWSWEIHLRALVLPAFLDGTPTGQPTARQGPHSPGRIHRSVACRPTCFGRPVQTPL